MFPTWSLIIFKHIITYLKNDFYDAFAIWSWMPCCFLFPQHRSLGRILCLRGAVELMASAGIQFWTWVQEKDVLQPRYWKRPMMRKNLCFVVVETCMFICKILMKNQVWLWTMVFGTLEITTFGFHEGALGLNKTVTPTGGDPAGVCLSISNAKRS